MAKSRKVTVSKTRSVTRTQAAPEAEVEVVEESKGMGWEGGVAIITTILLLVAILMTDYDLGKHYGTGMFFKP
jgi:hypothetical protein